MEDQYIEEIKKLKEQRLSERKIAEALNISRNQVRNALQEIRIEEVGEDSVPEDKMRSIIREELERAKDADEGEESKTSEFPMMRKAGGGMEVTAPEAVLKQYMGGTEAEALELKAIMKFRAAMLMVMDLVDIQKGLAEADARRMEPILRLMQHTREEQDAAKSSSEEIAGRAAQATAGQLYEAISQNQGQVNSSLEKIKQMIGGQSSDPFSQMVSMMQSMQQMSMMFGMPMPVMQQRGAPVTMPQGTPADVEPPPIERHSINEWEGK
jgi:hypothetical protein